MKQRRKRITAESRLKVGAWYEMRFMDGELLNVVCVIAMHRDRVCLECPSHLLTSARWMSRKEMFRGHMFRPVFLGYGKPRWFMGRIRRWTNCFGTLYTKPRP